MKHLFTLSPLRRVLVLAAAVLVSAAGHAAGLLPSAAFVEGAAADHRTYSATVGLIWPWSWKSDWFGGELTGSTEAFVSNWITRAESRREGYTLIGIVPLVRYRFSQGRSPWFLEGGIGLSVLDSRFVIASRQMSTALNFYDVVAAGRSFGGDNRHEVSLRLAHISNAGIKKPNPGQEFLQMRYAVRF